LRGAVRRVTRWLALGLAAAIALDLAVAAVPVFRLAFDNAPVRVEREPGDREFVHIEKWPSTLPANTAMLALLEANYGVVYTYEPLVGQDSDPFAGRVWRGHEDYQGEYWSPAGAVRLVRWSPSVIVLEAPPEADVFVNQNPGRYWLVNGRREFPSLRSVDRHAAFRVRSDAAGRVELSISPSGLPAGLAATLVGGAGLVLSYYVNRRLGRRQREHGEHAAAR
jgi:hypothetical protein